VSGSSTQWWHGRGSDGTRVLSMCVNTSCQPSRGLMGTNDWTCLRLSIRKPKVGCSDLACTEMLLSSSRTRSWHGRCCDGMRVWLNCFQHYIKLSTGLGKNGWSCFYLNSSFSLHKLACQILLVLKYADQFMSGSSTW
jgi:hypothetical protein